MTVFALTALSVETSTKRFAPNSTATSATVRVTSALLRTASSGLASMSGTCLYAAAWKTTAGRYFSKTWRIFVALPASASTAAVAWKSRSSTSSRSISKRPGSPLSTSTSRVGPMRAIWRQSSEPIEPPAPVTSTTSPERYPAIEARSASTGSRPRRSSTSTGRIWPARLRSPVMRSWSAGSVLTGTFSTRATSTMRSRTSPEADGMAMSSSSGRRSRTSSRSSAVVPRTRTPWRRRFFLRGSSSTSPIGV